MRPVPDRKAKSPRRQRDNATPPANGNGFADPANEADDPLFTVIKAALASIPLSARADEARHISDMLRMDAEDRAIQRLQFNPSLSDTRIAAMVGVSRTTLYTWKRYMDVKATLKAMRAPRRGFVDEDGALDAWDE